MDKECEELLEKIQYIAKNAPSKLQDELYPQKLGQRVMMQAPELLWQNLKQIKLLKVNTNINTNK